MGLLWLAVGARARGSVAPPAAAAAAAGRVFKAPSGAVGRTRGTVPRCAPVSKEWRGQGPSSRRPRLRPCPALVVALEGRGADHALPEPKGSARGGAPGAPRG